MKKVVLVVALLGVGSLTAQESQKEKLIIEKGTWNVGGNLSFRVSKNDNNDASQIRENENTSISFFPNVGYAVGKNIITGLGLGYGYSKSEILSANEGAINNFTSNDSRTFTIAPYIRGYFPLGEKLAFYTQGEVGFSKTKNTSDDENNNMVINERKNNSYFIGIRPGITYFVSKKLALETGIGFLGYTKTDSELKSDSGTFDQSGKASNFNFSLNSSDLLFGLSYYF
ncbi:hypothetical protein GGR42_002324 [Saonia flava]|uniref:Outer membrane protein beta-barrel domain-containing protein n=1 Tax=Saonia flava TaxID=523696 RepID=A0A846QYY8_9FLAO|nr:outer membrane beta-barrel protein [Saonia flava]NJB71862.1 hypothetical protein [Saonia flava]